MSGFANLKADGATTSGCWIYCASYTEDGNMAARRDATDPSNIGLYPKWAWAWPVNRRIIYNRASVDLNGEPWDKEHPTIKWDAAGKKWLGDVPDGAWAPMAVDPATTKYPFIMVNDGHARLFGAGMAEGPFAEHYEPWESPIQNPMSSQQANPCAYIWRPQEQSSADRFPIVCSTYRVCEHWQSGAMTRNNPWLVEAMPDPFVEISEELAAEKGIANGDRVFVENTRGRVNMVALVTKRYKPFHMNGRVVHQVGMTWHWGFIGLATGDSGNLLTPHIGDANTMIPEYKAFLCDISKT
ncbi:MAG: molybdopterin dinucleotide binding domain-containing protein, partial [Dehalococcoidia bacterium]|nr:molybdopterin dinucleotide binding domain-containing protein [Dehalococcoidia bacterium]